MSTDRSGSDVAVFLPAPSALVETGRPAVLVLLGVTVVGGVTGWQYLPSGEQELVVAVATIIGSALLAVLATTFLPSRVTYTVDLAPTEAAELVLRCSGVLTYRVPLRDILFVERADLQLSLVASPSVRLPGLALGLAQDVHGDVVRICATRTGDGVVLVRTADTVYGVTPRDEASFIAELRRHLRRG